MKRCCIAIVLHLLPVIAFSQTVPFVLKGALKENRQQLYRNLVRNTITKNLSLSLTDTTEEKWQAAFWAIQLTGYKSPWVDHKIHTAFNNIEERSDAFQQALMDLAHGNYPDDFLNETRSLLSLTKNQKIFSMCAEYLLSAKQDRKEQSYLLNKTNEWLSKDPGNPVLLQLQYDLKKNSFTKLSDTFITGILKKDYLPGNVLMISFQRNNRNYPGLVIVRDSAGHFLKEHDSLFAVPQLARSASNFPGYLTNGNTPEGIFRMDGFDTSMSNLIGPTTNIQLTMPFEYKASHYFRDSTLPDSNWNIDLYQKLLPSTLKDYYPVYQAYYAGKAGRTEIIAHGTTIDPVYYKNKLYYPLTPTLGCLCTKEIWNDETGRLLESDQQKLADAVLNAGGPAGYAIVINIDDQQKEVSRDEILYFLQQANQN